MTKTGERLIKSTKQAAAMAREAESDLVGRLGDLIPATVESHLESPWVEIMEARDRIQELEAELEHFKSSGIIEIAVRNPAVNEYMHHWERRAEKAEAQLSGVHAGTHCIVPVEPTEEMEHAAEQLDWGSCSVASLYRAMLATTPDKEG